ncbi:thioredoxin family protein [Micromonospora costi]|uniref:Thioredoxin n=1 Tax=Micromonospora costi TaxID=1530042 RepID=A0A3B0ADQ4_9ACTN|nr:thioredoxin domain-containing protein [Micromonospora costi]RKN58692.1 thiol reductase thioredoxin [Micromonospora costi]
MPQVAHHALTTVTDDSFAETVLAAERPVVVDVWAEWCPPCHAISRSLGELAEEFAGQLTIATLNSDENPETTRRYQVMSLPTLLVFRRGELVGSIVGSRPKNHLRQALARHLEG